MTKFQRVKNILAGLLMLLCAAILIIDPQDGYIVVMVVIDASLLIKSIKGFVYYFTLARYMVDGRKILYKNLLFFDLAVFVSAMMNVPQKMLTVYTAYIIGFAAIIDILYAFQAKKMKSPMWRRKIIYGLFELIICIISLCFIGNTDVMVYMYALLIIKSALTKIAEACRKTAMVYIN